MQHFTPTSVTSLSALALALALGSGCTLDSKFCVADCPQASGGSSTGSSQSTSGSGDDSTGDDSATTGPTTDPTTGDSDSSTSAGPSTGGDVDQPPTSCEIADEVPYSETCHNGVFQSGELCFGGGGSGGPVFETPIRSILPVMRGGKLDVYVAHEDGTTSWISGGLNGSPVPLAPVSMTSDPLFFDDHGDLDGDGDVDLVARTEGMSGDEIIIVNLDAAGGFDNGQLVFNGPALRGAHVVDRDGDGHNDVLLVTGPDDDAELLLLRGVGDGTFTEEPAIGLGVIPFFHAFGALDPDDVRDDFVFSHDAGFDIVRGDVVTGAVEIAEGLIPRELAIADLDKNGQGDIIALARQSGTDLSMFVIALQAADQTFAVTYYPVRCGSTVLAVGDINLDGHLDLAAAGPDSGGTTIRLGDGLGHFDVGGSMPAGDKPEQLYIVDGDGDGAPDLLDAPGSDVVWFTPQVP